MPRKTESPEEAARRVREEFDGYADSVELNPFETAAIIRKSPHTLKAWRLAGEGKGPTPIYTDGSVTYSAGEIRAWRDRRAKESHADYLTERRILIEKNRAERAAREAAAAAAAAAKTRRKAS